MTSLCPKLKKDNTTILVMGCYGNGNVIVTNMSKDYNEIEKWVTNRIYFFQTEFYHFIVKSLIFNPRSKSCSTLTSISNYLSHLPIYLHLLYKLKQREEVNRGKVLSKTPYLGTITITMIPTIFQSEPKSELPCTTLHKILHKISNLGVIRI